MFRMDPLKREYLKAKADFEKAFYNLMFELGLYNKFNKTYLLDIKNQTNYGFYAQLYLVPPLTFEDLQSKIAALQQNLSCIWIMKTKQFQKFAHVKIVIKDIDPKIPYENPGIKPYELFIGLDFSLKPIIIDLTKNCMVLMGGATGSGKTRLKQMILLSWILSCTPEEIEIYLADIAKDEYINFLGVPHIRYASELKELYEMIKHVESIFWHRKKILSKYRAQGIANGIAEYNKIAEKNKMKKLSYCIVDIDEFSILNIDKSDNEKEREMKQYILDVLKMLSKTGRNFGIFTFEAVQKCVKDEIPSIIKSNSAVRISMRANDYISSEVIMGDGSAVGLSERYGVYSLNGGAEKEYLFSPNLTTEMLNNLLEPYKKRRVIDQVTVKELPKKPVPYNPDAKTQDTHIIWHLNATFKPYKPPQQEKIEQPKQMLKFKNKSAIDC